MHKQEFIRNQLGVLETISPKYEITKRVKFLKEYLLHTGAEGFVLGISGGQDSSLAGKLCQMSINELRADGHQATFVAMRLPHNTQHDEEDAQSALAFISPDEIVTFNIGETTSVFSKEYFKSTKSGISDFNKGNVKARLRMIAQYSVAASRNLLVVGTDHAAEAVTGFFTKFGDGGADLLPLSGLSKRQGKQMLIELQSPATIYNKIPTADLLDEKPGQTDEENLGISYEEIDDFLEGKNIPEATQLKITNRFTTTLHKRNLPVTPDDVWWQ